MKWKYIYALIASFTQKLVISCCIGYETPNPSTAWNKLIRKWLAIKREKTILGNSLKYNSSKVNRVRDLIGFLTKQILAADWYAYRTCEPNVFECSCKILMVGCFARNFQLPKTAYQFLHKSKWKRDFNIYKSLVQSRSMGVFEKLVATLTIYQISTDSLFSQTEASGTKFIPRQSIPRNIRISAERTIAYGSRYRGSDTISHLQLSTTGLPFNQKMLWLSHSSHRKIIFVFVCLKLIHEKNILVRCSHNEEICRVCHRHFWFLIWCSLRCVSDTVVLHSAHETVGHLLGRSQIRKGQKNKTKRWLLWLERNDIFQV